MAADYKEEIVPSGEEILSEPDTHVVSVPADKDLGDKNSSCNKDPELLKE